MFNISHVSPRTSAFRRYWLFSAVILLTTLLAACSPDLQSGTPLAANQVFIFSNPGSPQNVLPNWNDPAHKPDGLSLDPAFAGDLYSQTVLNMIQLQLVTFDANLNIIPDAAKTWKRSDDGKIWTFTLRTGLKWSDGTPLTSKDFAFAIQHDLDPKLCDVNGPLNDPNPANRQSCAGGQAQNFFFNYVTDAAAYSQGIASTITGITTPDDLTISFSLINPISFFPFDLATMGSMPLEQSVFQKYKFDYIQHYTEGVAQSGPFMISSWNNPADPKVTDPQHSTTIIFKQNPNWWGKKPTLTEIDMPLISNLNDAYAAYNDNKTDYTLVPSHQFPYANNLPDFHLNQNLSIDYFGMNQLAAPFNNLQVRQSFDLALNKQLLVDTVFQGARTPTNHIIPLGIPGYNTQLLNPPDNASSDAVTGNQFKAKQLIGVIAQKCQSAYESWCQYIIGKSTVFKSATDVINPGCPDFKVGVDANGKSTQTPITVYAPTGNPDRILMAQDSVKEWASLLCLNVVADVTKPFATMLHDINQNINHSTSTDRPESIWTLAYSADYPDPQDYTTNQFAVGSVNNSSNVGTNGNDKDLEAQMLKADLESDPTTRYHLYQAIEQQLVNDVAWIPFSQPRLIYRVRQFVRNFTVPADGIIPDQSWYNIFIVSH